MKTTVGKYSLACRWLCSALVFWPLAYRMLVEKGSAVQFLALILLAALAGLVLLLNSLFCLARYRSRGVAGVSLIFLAVSGVGFAVAWYYLPQFRM